MRIIEILEKARNIIKDRGRWTVGSYARSLHGESVASLSQEAYSFCAMGAVRRARLVGISLDDSAVSDISNADKVLRKKAVERGYMGISELNDEGDHDRVLDMFDRAITELKHNGD